jgi:RNA polymerase sigma-70 factor (ECF subfamily)
MGADLHTTELRQLLERFQGGDRAAVDELFRRAAGRLERLAHAMLRRYPQVRRHEQTADVVQEALLSLLGALRELSFASAREFHGLAAEHIRRRLLDLARRYRRPGRAPASLEQALGGADRLPAPEIDPDDAERWHDLHEAVAALPDELREVFGLRFYHGWTHQEIADSLQVSTRTVTRLWFRAQVRLTERLGARPLPGEEGGPG